MSVVSVVGIDPSLASTGLARVYSNGVLEVSNVKTAGKEKDPLETTSARICAIANEILDYVKATPGVDMVVIESPSHGSRFGKPHERSGVWWLVVTALLNDGYKVARVAPQTRAMYATGAGNSKKDVVLCFVRELYTDILGRRIVNDDIADAILLADLGARQLGYPLPVREDPESALEGRYRALTGVLWPTT